MSKAISITAVSTDLNDVRLKEGGESLVPIDGTNGNRLKTFSKAFRDGKEGAIEQSLVRESVKVILERASKNLPSGYQLVVWETYTPKSLQESLRKKTLTESDMVGISHMTGGAVDVSLADREGNLLEMGTELNHGAPQNKTTLYFEELEKEGEEFTAADRKIRDNRRILYSAMSEAGFVNNPLAWFHWDYGNQWWASAVGKDAFYGPIVH